MTERNTVRRFDFRPLEKAIKTDNGFLKAPVFATRVGVFIYTKADGSTIREYRPPEEVFNKDSMSSLAGVPLTNRHPVAMVTSKNAKKLSVGYTSDMVEKDTIFVKTSVTVTDESMIKEIETEGIDQVSCGYSCDLEFTPGETPDGERFDAVQRNIRYNHLAVVDRGRAGPEVKLKLDADDAILEEQEYRKDINQQPKRKDVMSKATVKLDGVGYEVESDLAAPITSALQNARQDGEKEAKKKADLEMEEMKKKKDEDQAKIDGLEADLKKAKEEKIDAKDIHKMVIARASLVEKAGKHLDSKEVKMDEMTDFEIKKAVVAKVCDSLDLEGKSEVYVEARFDHIMETETAPTDKKDDDLKDVLKDKNNKDADDKVLSSDEVRAAKMKRDSEAWTQPVGYNLNK